jgi:hypothetical protein
MLFEFIPYRNVIAKAQPALRTEGIIHLESFGLKAPQKKQSG